MNPSDYVPDFDPIEKAENAVDSVSNTVQRLNKYLAGEYVCDHCNTPCEPETTYSDRQCMEVRSWHCPQCETDYYRESPYTDEPLDQPRER